MRNLLKRLLKIIYGKSSVREIKKKNIIAGIFLVIIVIYVGSFVYYRRSVNKIENYFYTQFEEKVLSGLYSIEANLNENVNLLIYKSSTNLTPVPQRVPSALNFIESKSRDIVTECSFVKKILFLDFKDRKCIRIYPDKKVLNIPREIVSFKGLAVSTKKITKNLFYVYVPNTETEEVDSFIWGLVIVPIRAESKSKKGKILGNIFFLFDVSEMIKEFVYGKSLTPGFRFSLVDKNEYVEGGEFVKAISWDNKKLVIKFEQTPMIESSWKRYSNNTKNTFFIYMIVVWILIFIGGIMIVYLTDRIRDLHEEITQREKEDRRNMEALAKLMSDTASSGISSSRFVESLKTALSTIAEHDDSLSFAIFDSISKRKLFEHISKESQKIDFQKSFDFPESGDFVTTEIKVSRGEIYRIILHDETMQESGERKDYYESVLRIIDLGAEALAQRNLRQGMELKMFRTILKLLGSKDHYTCNHSLSMAAIAEYIATLLADKYGFSKIDIEAIRYAGFLHDIGKMGIPDEILNKQGKYTPEEMAIMIKHPLFTEIMIEPLAEISDFYDRVLNIAIRHHERGNGSGYPYGIIRRPDDPAKQREYLDNCFNKYRNDPKKQKRVCVFFEPIMQVLAVADVLDATLRDRPYKSALKDEEIKKILKSMKEKGEIDPEIIDETIKNFDEIKSIRPKLDTDDCESFPSLPIEIMKRFLPGDKGNSAS